MIYFHKTKAIFRHAYRSNRLLGRAGNRYVVRLNIREVPLRCLLVVKNELSKRLQRYEAKSNLGENCQIKKVQKNKIKTCQGSN